MTSMASRVSPFFHVIGGRSIIISIEQFVNGLVVFGPSMGMKVGWEGL